MPKKLKVYEIEKEKQVERFYDRIAEGYDATHGLRVADAILEHFLIKSLPNGEKLNILDAGGGIGRFALPLLQKGHKVAVSDISQEMLKSAQKNLARYDEASFVKESVTNMTRHKEEEFHVVILMNAILDYCGNHLKALKEAYRVLKKKGRMIGNVNNRLIYCQNHELIEGKYDEFRKSMSTGNRHIIWADQKEGHMTHEFTLKELKRDLEITGFKIIKILGPFNLLPKYRLDDINNKEEYIKLQIEYAELQEYINNSQDFFFVAEK
ncbi:MAG: class I SAM-dependent methyltransferase [Nanoarchaeota archaeon]|nr:class I SAM-dependent methyltransferase [Nanoarchaeota archaeon]